MLARLLGALFATMLAAPASAWDNFGHMEVAQIAWDLLNDNARTRVAQLIRLNPQYVAWTVNVVPEKRDQIAFLRAATWADYIKNAPHYIKDGTSDGNRPPAGREAGQNVGYIDMNMHKYWHFVDEPFSIDKTPLEDPSVPNAQTQIALFRRTLASPVETDDVKSYDLVWLLHLVGDVHQPLHATSGFSVSEQHGDSGGNDEKINCGGCQETVVHWFWDDTPGSSENPEDAITAAHALPPADPRQAAVRDEKAWITESFELAQQVVYQPPVSVGPGPFTLTDAYKAQAVQIAKQRVMLAGTRLAALLNTALAMPVDPRLGCDTANMPQPDPSQPENIDFVKKRMLYYRCNAYDDDVAKVLASAGRWIASRASQVPHPAVVLDIDETSLSNWPRIFLDDFAYIPNGTCPGLVGHICGDLDWQQSGRAQAVGPTLQLYKAARCIDQQGSCTPIDVFFVTGRRQTERNYEMTSGWTLRNLDVAGYGPVDAEHLYLRDPHAGGTVAEYKSSARADIEKKGYTIIANIGDQNSDLAGGHAEMTFKIPNPFYFIP